MASDPNEEQRPNEDFGDAEAAVARLAAHLSFILLLTFHSFATTASELSIDIIKPRYVELARGRRMRWIRLDM